MLCDLQLPEKGVLNEVLADLVAAPPKPQPARLAILACGVKIHFPWDRACERFRQAATLAREATGELPVEIVAADEPFEDPDALLAFLDSELAKGLAGVIFFHAAYTAGEIGSALGRWLLDHPLPLLSWAWPEPGTGDRNEANSLTCQNFILQMLGSLGVPYAWQHLPLDRSAVAPLESFARACYARHGFRRAKLLHAGGSRVTAFYDGEVDELAVFRTLGCRFDRVDLETVYQHACKRFTDAEVHRLVTALTAHPACARVDVPEEQMMQTYRFGLGMLDLAHEHGYLGATVKSWPDLFDCYGCAIDGSVSMMNDYGFCVAEEGEMNGLLSSLALFLVSNGKAVPTMMDLSLWKQAQDRLGIWHCGASPTRLLKPGTAFAATRHSILENGDSETAVGLMLEFLLACGPVTVLRYLAPDAGQWFGFEGEFVETDLDYRGTYGLMKATGEASLGRIMHTILSRGLDHHWSVGYGHWHNELRQLNHFCGIGETPLAPAETPHGLSLRAR
jgi:L-fucose isomerase-like protein